jgi:hypothetical protein
MKLHAKQILHLAGRLTGLVGIVLTTRLRKPLIMLVESHNVDSRSAFLVRAAEEAMRRKTEAA